MNTEALRKMIDAIPETARATILCGSLEQMTWLLNEVDRLNAVISDRQAVIGRMMGEAARAGIAASTVASVPPVTLGHGWVHDGDAAFNPATGERQPYDFPPAAPERALCSKCCGEGVIHTGIDESPTTQCGKCEGTGLAISASTPAAPIGRDSILEEAALECENGCLPGETSDPVDASYNMAMHHAAHTIRSLKGSAAPLAVPLPAEHGAPKLTLRNGIWWPEGYVTDPDGRIIAPAGRHTDFNFGYDQGYADGLKSIKDTVANIERRAIAGAAPAQQQEPSDTTRLDYLDVWRQAGVKRGFHWNSLHFDMDKPVREQLDAIIARETANQANRDARLAAIPAEQPKDEPA